MVVGKTVNFIKQCCGDEQWVAESMHAIASNTDMAATLDGIKPVVDEASNLDHQRLLSLILGKYSLLEHCQAVRKYMFLGQGDMIENLLDALEYVFHHPLTLTP